MLSFVQAAGWPIYPLIVCSVFMLAIVVERCIQLRPAKVNPAAAAQQALQLLQKKNISHHEIEKVAQGSLLGSVLAAGLRARQTFGDNAREIELAMELAGRQGSHVLEKRLALLGTIASAAPLMGLLGTVVGMIEVFGVQSTGSVGNSGDPVALAHGISVALYNTAFGLIVAIPALLFWRYFRSRVDAYVLELEIGAERFSRHLCLHKITR